MNLVLIIIHVSVCVGLIALVLIQRGRGGGFVEAFSGLDSVFGTKTSAFLTRSTTVLSIIFFLTCLGLAVVSVRQSRSLMQNVAPATTKAAVNTTANQAKTDIPSATSAATPSADVPPAKAVAPKTAIPQAQ